MVLSSCIYREVKFELSRSLKIEEIQTKKLAIGIERPDWYISRDEGDSL